MGTLYKSVAAALFLSGSYGYAQDAVPSAEIFDAQQVACFSAPTKPCLIDEAFTLVDGVNLRIAKTLLQGWLSAQVFNQAMFDEALGSFIRITDKSTLNTVVTEVAIAQSEAGFTQNAINAVLKIRSLNQRFVLLAKVASITKSNSLLDTLQGVIPSYLDDSSVAAGTLAILDVLARNGRAEAALEAARAIQDDLSRASALGTVGAAANDAGLVLEGLAIIQNNESGASDFTIRLAIRTFPEHLLEVGMLQEAITLANTFDSGGAQSNKLASISSMLAESGRIDEAIVVASQIDNNGTEAGGLPVSLFRDRAIAAVIVALANAERFEETQAALLDFENHAGADTVKAQVAIAYANAGQYNEAMALLSQIENTKAITYAKLGIVTVLAKNGAVNDALSLAHSIDSNYRRARAYAEIAVQLE